MARPRMRPTFAIEVECTADQLMNTIRRHLELRVRDVEGEFTNRHGLLRVPMSRMRFWTPCLDLTIEEADSDATKAELSPTKLWGTFSPRPEIWTGFVFAIGTLIVVSIFAGMYGVAQLALGHSPVALLIPVIAAVLGALIYASALVGQGLSITEMYRLRSFVDDCMREAETLASHEPRTAQDSAQL